MSQKLCVKIRVKAEKADSVAKLFFCVCVHSKRQCYLLKTYVFKGEWQWSQTHAELLFLPLKIWIKSKIRFYEFVFIKNKTFHFFLIFSYRSPAVFQYQVHFLLLFFLMKEIFFCVSASLISFFILKNDH